MAFGCGAAHVFSAWQATLHASAKTFTFALWRWPFAARGGGHAGGIGARRLRSAAWAAAAVVRCMVLPESAAPSSARRPGGAAAVLRYCVYARGSAPAGCM
jgi:hypothetical protein